MEKAALLIGLAWILFATSVATGRQDPNVENNFIDMSIEELMEVKIDTVSSASKYEQKVIEAPSSITIITSEEIHKYGYRTLMDILSSVPGFYNTYDRNYGYIGVRGFGRPGDYNSRILLLIDGHRINENVGNSFGVVSNFQLDLDIIERIEVVRGPGSALYGSNALFAVINVITQNGRDFGGLELSGKLASFDTVKGRLTYGDSFDGLDMLVSGTYYNQEGQTLFYPEFADPSTNYGKVTNDDDNSENFLIKASSSGLIFVATHVKREKGIPTAPWECVFGNNGTRTWDCADIIGLAYQHDYSDDFSVSTKLSYNVYDYYGEWVSDDGGIYNNRDYWKGRWWIGEVQFTNKFERHKITYGVEAQYNVRQDQKCWDYEIYLDDHDSSKSWGVYLQDEFKILDNLIFFGGLRRDYFDVTGDTINPRIGMIYNPFNDTTVKLLFGKAFRSPSVYELYYQDGYTVKSNPALKPETIKTYEIVLEKYFNKNLHGSISGYYYKMQDLIDQTIDKDGWIIFDNLTEVNARGVETALDGKWDNGVRGKVAYSQVQTFDKTNRSSLANSPKHMINFNIIVSLIKDALFAGLETKYTSKRKTLAGHYAGDSIVTNLTLTYENVLKKLEVQMGIYNLFDEEYGHPGFVEHTQDVIDQDGRNFGVKLTYHF